MAPFIPAAGCGKFEMRFTQQGQQVENVFHIKTGSAMTTTELTSYAQDFKTWWDTNIKPLVKNTVSLNSIVATALDTATSPGIVYTTGLPIVGTNGGVEMPMNVTFAVRWLTALRGRSFTGRTYHVGIVTINTIGSTIEPVAKGVITTAYNNLVGIMSGAGVGLAVVSYRHNLAARTAAVATLITGCSIDGDLDSQRRRLPGRGR
jgi:hypothetical protein